MPWKHYACWRGSLRKVGLIRWRVHSPEGGLEQHYFLRSAGKVSCAMKFSEYMKFGIGFKLGLLLAAFGILSTSLTAYYFYSSSRNMLTRAAERDLLTATQVVGRNMKIIIAVIAEDSQLLAAIPATSNVFGSPDELTTKRDKNILADTVTNVFSSPDKLTTERDKNILADTFGAMLKAHPEYFQIRLISTSRQGMELVRVDRDGEKLTRVSSANLQHREKKPYVTGTLRLARGDIYLSDITINHEEGTHSALNKPTVTVSTPVFSRTGKRLGLIVINVDLNGLARLLKSNLPSAYQLYLSNQWGDFLVHPDESQTFGFDRGKRILIQDSFEDVLPLVQGKGMNVVTNIEGEPQKQGGQVAAFVRLPFGDTIDKRFVILGLSQPVDNITRETDSLRWDTIRIILAFSSLALIFSVLLARIVTGPLIAMVSAINRFSKDQVISTRPLGRNDELGLLSRSFHDMQTQIMMNLAELNESKKTLDHLARHDTLTGLPNRRMFYDRLEHSIATSRRSGKKLAVLFVDLDGFKEINDTFGHAVGDKVLINVANLLKSAIRETDTVARLGGDEYVILLDMIDDSRHVKTILRKLHDLFQSAMQIDGSDLKVRASIGAAIYPRDGKDADELIQYSDQAMYNSKKVGGNTSSFKAYVPEE
jgi:diguanylate cyclase